MISLLWAAQLASPPQPPLVRFLPTICDQRRLQGPLAATVLVTIVAPDAPADSSTQAAEQVRFYANDVDTHLPWYSSLFGRDWVSMELGALGSQVHVQLHLGPRTDPGDLVLRGELPQAMGWDRCTASIEVQLPLTGAWIAYGPCEPRNPRWKGASLGATLPPGIGLRTLSLGEEAYSTMV